MIDYIYHYYVRPSIGVKGQNLVEYALLLAVVIGVGYLIYTTAGLQENIKDIFDNANTVTHTAMPATRYSS